MEAQPRGSAERGAESGHGRAEAPPLSRLGEASRAARSPCPAPRSPRGPTERKRPQGPEGRPTLARISRRGVGVGRPPLPPPRPWLPATCSVALGRLPSVSGPQFLSSKKRRLESIFSKLPPGRSGLRNDLPFSDWKLLLPRWPSSGPWVISDGSYLFCLLQARTVEVQLRLPVAVCTLSPPAPHLPVKSQSPSARVSRPYPVVTATQLCPCSKSSH